MLAQTAAAQSANISAAGTQASFTSIAKYQSHIASPIRNSDPAVTASPSSLMRSLPLGRCGRPASIEDWKSCVFWPLGGCWFCAASVGWFVELALLVAADDGGWGPERDLTIL